jgi:nucleoid-associated protein YgaU
MALEKLEILTEEPGAGLPQFNPNNSANKIVCNMDSKNNDVKMFNPNLFTITRTVAWPPQAVTKRDSPELQHTGAIEPSTLNIELFLDTYDSPDKIKKSVRMITDKLINLTKVISEKHRPPVCRLTWGNMGNMNGFFQGVLENLVLKFNLFMEDGTPVRATATCTFKAWTPNETDLKEQNLMSADVAKVWVIKRGQTLASIAMHEYGDPRKWRPIAQANGIDDPTKLYPGTVLVLPALRSA